MIVQTRKLMPVALCGVVLGMVIVAEFLDRYVESFDYVRPLEWITYDWRVQQAAKREAPAASNLGLVFINDGSIWYLKSGLAGYTNTDPVEVDLYWPRYVYGELVKELTHQGVDVVGFDILLKELRPKTEVIELPDGSKEMSDYYFARQLAASGRVVLAAEGNLKGGTVPVTALRTNAWALGDITSSTDGGVMRRTKAFEDYVILEPIIEEAREKLDQFLFDTNRIVYTPPGQSSVILPIAPDGTFEKARLVELADNVQLPPGPGRRGLAFRRHRVWDLGLTMAAHYLGINLAAAEIFPGSHIALRGTNSVRREIPIDAQNRFYIDWSLEARDARVYRESFHSVLDNHYKRAAGNPRVDNNPWRGRVALVGSIASGNDLADLGATPLDSRAYLTTRYLNIANSMLVNRFVRQPSHLVELMLILGLGLFSGIFSWNFRIHFAGLCVLLLGVLYTALALYLYIANRYWMPMVLPLGGLFAVHMALVTYRVAVEQKERRRIRSIFAKIVSPNVVNELLRAERLKLGGARREITVFFSDVRGFTEMTDESHARAEEHVKARQMASDVAEAYFDQQAEEVLKTVNLYLGTIADVVKKSEGTLDKYIGDCVMAFWGDPTPNEHHAVTCVRAAIEAQRAIDVLNQQRIVENARRARENAQRASQSIPPLPALKILTMGAGINTGVVTIGLMGSERHVYSYTAFGRDVNLAARLEGISGSGRILIGESTYRSLQRDDPTLAASCTELAPATVKGFRTPVKVYEVPWSASSNPDVPSIRQTQPAHDSPAPSP